MDGGKELGFENEGDFRVRVFAYDVDGAPLLFDNGVALTGGVEILPNEDPSGCDFNLKGGSTPNCQRSCRPGAGSTCDVNPPYWTGYDCTVPNVLMRLVFRVEDPSLLEHEREIYSFAYAGAGVHSPNTFYAPFGSTMQANQDAHIRYYLDPVTGEGRILSKVEPLKTLSQPYIEDLLGDTWVMPYNLDYVCAQPGANCPQDYDTYNIFLTPVPIDPKDSSPVLPPVYTFADEADVVVPSSFDWDWEVSGLQLRFPANRTLVVEGDLEADGVTLTTSGPVINDRAQAPWDGIAVYSGGSLSLNDVTVQYAETGVTVYSDDVTITNTTIRNNDVGIESGLVRNYCSGGSPCPSGGLSSFTLEGTEVAYNSGIGVLARNAEDVVMRASNGTNTTIHDNGGDGLYLWNATVDEFRETHIDDNGGVGANVLDNADLRFTDVLDPAQPPGLDRVASNASHELFVSAGGYLFLGKSSAGGDNDVYDDLAPLGPSNRLVYNEQPCSGMLCAERVVDAEHTWWGGASGPPSGAFGGGPVDWQPHRTSPATGGSRPASPVVAGVGDAAGRGDSAWLREAIREARRSLNESPGAEGAGALVRRLYGLQRLDPADALGEHGPTMALLSVLRARLGQGQLPTPLRAAAEAALVAEVHDAVRLRAYDEADGLLRVFDETVEGPEARRSLALARVMVAEQAGQYEEALAVLGGVTAELDAESPMREALAVLAEALAEETRGVEGRPVGSALAAASRSETALVVGGVLGAPYPNPSAGAAVVPLMLSEAAEVNVAVFDVLGRRVATLAEGTFEVGAHRLTLDASVLPAGLYVIHAAVGDTRGVTQRLTVLR